MHAHKAQGRPRGTASKGRHAYAQGTGPRGTAIRGGNSVCNCGRQADSIQDVDREKIKLEKIISDPALHPAVVAKMAYLHKSMRNCNW